MSRRIVAAMENESKKAFTAVSQMQVVLLAVHLLGGDSRSVDTEDVAVSYTHLRAHET